MTEYYAAVVEEVGVFGIGKSEGEAIGKALDYFSKNEIPGAELYVTTISEGLYSYIQSEYGGIVPKEEHLKRWKKLKEEPQVCDKPLSREEQFNIVADFLTGRYV